MEPLYEADAVYGVQYNTTCQITGRWRVCRGLYTHYNPILANFEGDFSGGLVLYCTRVSTTLRTVLPYFSTTGTGTTGAVCERVQGIIIILNSAHQWQQAPLFAPNSRCGQAVVFIKPLKPEKMVGGRPGL